MLYFKFQMATLAHKLGKDYNFPKVHIQLRKETFEEAYFSLRNYSSFFFI